MENKPIAWMYKTEVCNRIEEEEFSGDSGYRRWSEKVLEIVPLYLKPEPKTYWWILDEWGILNFFDKHSDFLHARKHVDGLAEWDTTRAGSFQATIGGIECWKTEELLKWKDGIYSDD